MRKFKRLFRLNIDTIQLTDYWGPMPILRSTKTSDTNIMADLFIQLPNMVLSNPHDKEMVLRPNISQFDDK